MELGNKTFDATLLKAKGRNIVEIEANIKGTEFSIEDVHDSKWQYEISYMKNGIEYFGSTYQYIHWAPRFVMDYYERLFEDGGKIRIRIDSDNPSSYDTNMDYAIVMSIGPAYNESGESNDIDIVDVAEISKCVELKIKGAFYDETHFTKSIFRLLTLGYEKFIFNIIEISNYGASLTGAIRWAQRYIRAFTCDNKYAILKREGINIQSTDCRIISDSRDDIIEKFITNYMTEEEKKVAEFAKLTDKEKEKFKQKELLKFYESFKSADEFVDFQMSTFYPMLQFSNDSFDEARKILEEKETLTIEEEKLKKDIDERGKIDFEEEKKKIRDLLKDQWNQAMKNRAEANHDN